MVDDDESFVSTLRTFFDVSEELECAGIYRSAAEALKAIPAAPPNVVLKGIRVGGMSGIECAWRLKTVLPALRIIIVSANVEKQLVLAALMARASGYLIQPVSVEELERSIHSVLEGGVALSPVAQVEIVQVFHHLSGLNQKHLSEREREILGLLFERKTDKEIADKLHISEGTIHTHEQHIWALIPASRPSPNSSVLNSAVVRRSETHGTRLQVKC